MDYGLYKGQWDIVEYQLRSARGWNSEGILMPGEMIFDLDELGNLIEYDRRDVGFCMSGYELDPETGIITQEEWTTAYVFGREPDTRWLYLFDRSSYPDTGPEDIIKHNAFARSRLERPNLFKT